MQNPAQFKIPEWFLNRQRDITTGKSGHLLSNVIDQQMRADLERLKKIRSHRGLRHHWGLKVRGQHTCTTYVYFHPYSFSSTLLSFHPSPIFEEGTSADSLAVDEERPSLPRRSSVGFLVLDWSCVGYLGVDARLSPLPSGPGHGDVADVFMLTLLIAHDQADSAWVLRTSGMAWEEGLKRRSHTCSGCPKDARRSARDMVKHSQPSLLDRALSLSINNQSLS
jgi:hypothetical protein